MLKRFITLLLVCYLLFTDGGAWMSAFSAQRPVTVALVIDASSSLHEKVVTGIKQVIEISGGSGLDFTTVDINEPGSASALSNGSIDYAIVVGIKPTQFTHHLDLHYPALYTLVPENSYLDIVAKSLHDGAHHPDDDYVIYLGQKPARTLALTEAVMGHGNHIGMVAGDYSSGEAEEFKRAAKEQDVDLFVKESSTKESALDDIKQVLMETDAYIALYDPTILNRQNAKWLLYMAYKMKKPVIGYSSSYTSAGAVASIFSTPEQIGRQSGEWLLNMLEGRAVDHQQYPGYFTVTTNTNIQRLLRLKHLSPEELTDIVKSREQNRR